MITEDDILDEEVVNKRGRGREDYVMESFMLIVLYEMLLGQYILK
jgi:hypothetical protein